MNMYYQHAETGEVVDWGLPGGYPEGTWKRITAKAYAAAVKASACAELRKLLPPGSTAHTVLRRVSKSGMMRHISVVVCRDGRPEDVTWLVARAMGETFQQDTGGIKVGGCGMDMGFHLIYSLSRTLYPDGFGVEMSHPIRGKLRPLTREKAEKALARGYTARGRNHDESGWDNDGGYAVSHRWL